MAKADIKNGLQRAFLRKQERPSEGITQGARSKRAGGRTASGREPDGIWLVHSGRYK